MQLFVSGALFIVPKQNNVNASESAAVACAAFNVEAVEPTHLFDDDSGDDIEIEYSDDTQSRSGRRLLLDTYGESLTRVNRLYTQRYGKPEFNQARRVPAHMPHLLDTEVIKSMQSEWAEEWRETARNRFRSGTDMQYAFSYFHYIMSKAKNAEPDFDVIWKEEVDTNGDGILDGNEIITLASLALGKEPDDLYISEVYECVATQFSAKHWLIDTFASRGQGKSERQRRWETRSPRIATCVSNFVVLLTFCTSQACLYKKMRASRKRCHASCKKTRRATRVEFPRRTSTS